MEPLKPVMDGAATVNWQDNSENSAGVEDLVKEATELVAKNMSGSNRSMGAKVQQEENSQSNADQSMQMEGPKTPTSPSKTQDSVSLQESEAAIVEINNGDADVSELQTSAHTSKSANSTGFDEEEILDMVEGDEETIEEIMDDSEGYVEETLHEDSEEEIAEDENFEDVIESLRSFSRANSMEEDPPVPQPVKEDMFMEPTDVQKPVQGNDPAPATASPSRVHPTSPVATKSQPLARGCESPGATTVQTGNTDQLQKSPTKTINSLPLTQSETIKPELAEEPPVGERRSPISATNVGAMVEPAPLMEESISTPVTAASQSNSPGTSPQPNSPVAVASQSLAFGSVTGDNISAERSSKNESEGLYEGVTTEAPLSATAMEPESTPASIPPLSLAPPQGFSPVKQRKPAVASQEKSDIDAPPSGKKGIPVSAFSVPMPCPEDEDDSTYKPRNKNNSPRVAAGALAGAAVGAGVMAAATRPEPPTIQRTTAVGAAPPRVSSHLESHEPTDEATADRYNEAAPTVATMASVQEGNVSDEREAGEGEDIYSNEEEEEVEEEYEDEEEEDIEEDDVNEDEEGIEEEIVEVEEEEEVEEEDEVEEEQDQYNGSGPVDLDDMEEDEQEDLVYVPAVDPHDEYNYANRGTSYLNPTPLVGNSKEGDIESGQPADSGINADKTVEKDWKKSEDSKKPKRSERPALTSNEREWQAQRSLMPFICCLLCIMLIAVIIIVPLLLFRDDNSKSQEITDSPTWAPTMDILRYEQSYGPVSGADGTDFGHSVSYDNGLMVVGAPTGTTGLVSSFFVNSKGDMTYAGDVVGEEAGGRFGWSVDISNRALAVGAPLVNAFQTPTDAGAAYFYQYSDVTASWKQVGSVIRGDETPQAANEEFGSAVATAGKGGFRVAIGAPMSNLKAMGAGRVYTFGFSSDKWASIETAPITGERAGDRFGSAVAISDDGSSFIAGAPGSDGHDDPGYVHAFRAAVGQATWQLSFALAGSEKNEEFGASVAMLSENGDMFAIGAPGYKNGSGRVLVYSRSSNGFHTQVGSDIVGNTGERIGGKGTLSGSLSQTGPSILVATASGTVRRFDYDKAEAAWLNKYQTLDPPFRDAISSLSTAGADSQFLVIGGVQGNEVGVFDATGSTAQGVNPAATPTSSPDTPQATPAPTAPPVATPTIAPAKAPTASPVAPTSSPTFASLLSYQVLGTPFTVNAPNSGFGSSVGLSDSLMAVGAPSALGVGAVLTYQAGADTTFVPSEELYNPQTNSGFGYSVDVSGSALVAGAPFVYVPGTTTEAGAAYYYELVNGAFQVLGSPLVGTQATGELFGASVGLSGNRRVVVGASGASVGRGSLSIFEYVGNDWVRQESVLGLAGGDALGTAVDIDDSGSLVVAGAPGEAVGYAVVFEKVGDTWTNTFVVTGDETGEALGTSVVVLSSGYFAVGAPGYQGGRGRIVVFEKVGSEFVRLPDLVGDAGDRLGATNNLSGSVSTLVVTTANGRVKRFDFDPSTNKWTQITKIVDTGYGSNLDSVASSPGAQKFVVGASSEAKIYAL